MKKIILASKSAARIKILKNSGIKFKAIAADLKESDFKKQIYESNFKQTALELARAKSKIISQYNKNSFVIGADQILECESQLFSKADNFNEMYEILQFLRNKKHYLINGIAIFLNNEEVWHYTNKVSMVMRDFSDDFLKQYVKNNPEAINSVGCYNIEGEGIKLFSKISSDYFSILGLPLIPVLNFLRTKGIIKK